MKKTCSKCKTEKYHAEFNKSSENKDGIGSYCRACAKNYLAVYRVDNAEKLRAYSAVNAEKINACSAAWRESNSEKERVYGAAWREANIEKHHANGLAWRKGNMEHLRGTRRIYRKANLGKFAAYSGKRRARKLNATPEWANEFFIEEAYDLAKIRTKITGFEWHVDHIIPLQGRNVCGLHVENNLQVIPWFENISKGNKYA